MTKVLITRWPYEGRETQGAETEGEHHVVMEAEFGVVHLQAKFSDKSSVSIRRGITLGY